MRVAGLIPALDCQSTIATVVEGARQHLPLVLVVDDGSHDATATVAKGAGAEVISHACNLGKGAALRSGFTELLQRGFTHAVTIDGDGQHLADQIPLLLAASSVDARALILGDRRLDSVDAAAALNRFGNRFANRWVEIACGLKIPDTQSGFRIYPLDLVLNLGVRASHFAFETEVLIRAARAEIPIRSVGVRVYYPPPQERTSHFRKVVDTTRIVLVVVGLILRLW